MSANVILVEDYTSFRNAMAPLFEREGMVVAQAGTLAKARQLLMDSRAPSL